MMSRTRRRLIVVGTALFGCGTLVGAAGMSLATRERIAPQLVPANHLQFGTAEDGKPALCDDDGVAFRVYDSGGITLLGIAARDDGVTENGIRKLESMSCR